MIQLWRDQVKGPTKTIYIRFMSYRYDHQTRQFQLEEDCLSIPLERCALIDGSSGKGQVMTDGGGTISRTAASQISSAGGRIPEFLPCKF